MWKCELCNKEFRDDILAVEVRFGYMAKDKITGTDPYQLFCPESGIAPICDDCAISYLRGEIH